MAKNGKDYRSIIGKRQVRNLTLKRADLQIDEQTRTVELSFSSETPVERWFGVEILDHSEGACLLDRLNASAPLLKDHNPDIQTGVVEEARIVEGRGRATVRFSRRPVAQEEFDDVRDGIRVNVSVGYVIHEITLLEKSDDGPSTYLATKWEPLEISIVSIPADLAVGVGRAMEEEEEKSRMNEEEEKLHDPETCEIEDCAECERDEEEEEERDEEEEEERKRQRPSRQKTKKTARAASTNHIQVRTLKMQPDLIETFKKEGEFFNEPDMAREFYAGGKTVEEFRAAVLQKTREQQKNLPHGKPVVALNERERQSYSVSRAILSAADEKNSFEREVSDQIGKELGRQSNGKHSVFLPTGVALRGMNMQRTPLTSGSADKGADIVFTEPGSFIDMLRNRAKVIQLGATVLPGLRGPVAFPKQTGAGTLFWMAENPGADVTESNLTLDQVTLTPKTAMAMEAYSRQLLAQASIAADQLVTNDLVRIAALGIDRAALHGSGSSNEPTGLYTLSGVNSVAFGGAVSFPKVVAMETEIESDNAEGESMAYLTTPNVKGNAKTTQKFASTNGVPIWEGGEMNGYRAEATNQLRKDMGAGTNEHGIIFGVWPHLYIGEWGAVELLVDPFTQGAKGLIRVIEFLMVDIAARYAESFTKGTGLTVS